MERFFELQSFYHWDVKKIGHARLFWDKQPTPRLQLFTSPCEVAEGR